MTEPPLSVRAMSNLRRATLTPQARWSAGFTGRYRTDSVHHEEGFGTSGLGRSAAMSAQ